MKLQDLSTMVISSLVQWVGTAVGSLFVPVMGGWAIAVTPPESRIILQTNLGGSEQLMLILAWVHPKGSVLMWLTKSESLAKPISVYLTSSITDTSLARY